MIRLLGFESRSKEHRQACLGGWESALGAGFVGILRHRGWQDMVGHGGNSAPCKRNF